MSAGRGKRTTSGPRRTGRRATPVEARLELISRAREALPLLPTDSLYRIYDLLETALAKPDLDPDALDELERALQPASR